MKIKYILETIGPKGLRDRAEKSFEEKEITLGRGSSCDVLLASRLVSFNHARISIADDKLFLEELEGQAGTTLVNNQAVSKGSLVPGDTLKIGDVVLRVELDSEVWSLIEVRSSEGQLDAKEEVRKQLDLLTVAKRVPSIYVWAVAIVIPVLVFLVAAPILGLNEPIWESGPMTRSHKFLQTDCRSCHEKNFEMVSDQSCKKCHDMGDHVEFLTSHSKFNEKCGSCHREHIDDEALILTKSDLCLHCHANIQEINVNTEYPAINGFNRTHPDFELVRTNKVDRAKLKLNHKYHLQSIEMDDSKTGKKRLMECADCHIPDTNGEYMDPITFDKYCVSCHKLKMGGAAHMLRVPHVKTSLVRTFLKNPKEFLYEYIDSKPEDLMEAPKDSGGRGRGRGRRSSGPPPAPVQKPIFDWVKGNIEKIEQRGGLLGSENEIIFSAQGGCIECHELNVKPVGDINSDGSLVAVSLWEHDLRLWDGKNGKDKAVLKGHQGIVNSASFSLDGTRLVTASKDFTARVWGAFEKEGPVSEEITNELNSGGEASGEPALGSAEGVVAPEEPKSPELIESSLLFKGHKGSVNDAVFNPNQDKILTGSEDGFTIVWDVDTQKPIQKLQEQTDPVTKVRFNSDGSLAAALNARFNVSIWEVGSGDLKTVLRTRNQQIVDIEFSPVNPSKIAAAFSEGSIRIYDLEDKNGLVKLTGGLGPYGKKTGHDLEVTSIVFSPDGSRLASVSRDMSAKIWDANAGKVLSTLVVYDKKQKEELKDQRFLSISFSGDGQKVVTGSTDKMVRLWDVSTGKLLKEFTGHENAVSLAMFAEKVDYFLSASDENLAMLWNLGAESKDVFRHGEAQALKEQIVAAASSESVEGTDAGETDNEIKISSELRLPKTLPTNVPSKFFQKGFFSHRKHEYLECNNCHSDVKESIFTSDVLLPSIKPCRTCHEKQGIHLDRCVVCHIYHPEGERNFMRGLLAPDRTAKLGYSYLRTRKSNSVGSFFGKE